MLDQQTARRPAGRRPAGEVLALESLPPPNPGRWVARRKAQVVAAIAGGLLTIDEACARYQLSVEELTSWQRLLDQDGLSALKVTRTQYYRARIDGF